MENFRVRLVLKIILFVLSSWILVHVLAAFGIFLALAYPLWYFFAPGNIPCILCQIKKTKECAVRHAFLNGGVILIFTVLSFGLVFAESQILFKLGFPPTPKTVYFVIPPKGQYRLGEIFPMKIEIVGIKIPVNAVQTDLSFDPQKLEAVEVSTKDSFANIFIQKEINNEVGFLRLTGGLPNPGFFAERGVFGTAYFRTKAPGVVKIEFLPSSLVLANDGRGTNVVKELAAVSYLVLPESLSPDEQKQQEQLILNPNVLGETTEQTQMKFYQEKEVLGTQVSQEIVREKKPDLGKSFLTVLEGVDRFTLSLWAKLAKPGKPDIIKPVNN